MPPGRMGDAPQAPGTWVSRGPLSHPAQLGSGPLPLPGPEWAAGGCAPAGSGLRVVRKVSLGGLEKPSCEPAAPGLGCLLGGEESALSLKIGAWRAWASAWAWGLGCFGEAGSHPQTGDQVQGEETSACLCCPTHARQALAPEMCAGPGFELSGRRQVLGGLSAVSQQLSWDGPDQAVR